ncbi:hypothetical protein IE81DRAFT_75628 [Ceraceosorus guamensis]|uniref:Uncharacterized protein n=1 Tax=Ceraceosorus guamensis TaxID=1522189 RepID=A0A316W1R2_9BASI|nr:hypothetical protein IE81DRAFT_75628 [Ceraceosorus guamensis]PWN43464.1 hypothetical protein IE81DRAFT_75628 [Ceraceosorus guamensis]
MQQTWVVRFSQPAASFPPRAGSHESRTSVHIDSCLTHNITNNDSAHSKGAIQAGSVDRLRLIKVGSGTQRAPSESRRHQSYHRQVAHLLVGRHHRNCWPGSAATARPTWSRPRSSRPRWDHDVLGLLASALLHYSITSQTASRRQPRSSSLLRSDLAKPSRLDPVTAIHSERKPLSKTSSPTSTFNSCMRFFSG